MKRFFCTLILLIGLFTVIMPTFAATKTTTAQSTKETTVTADNKTEEAAADKKDKKNIIATIEWKNGNFAKN